MQAGRKTESNGAAHCWVYIGRLSVTLSSRRVWGFHFFRAMNMIEFRGGRYPVRSFSFGLGVVHWRVGPRIRWARIASVLVMKIRR